MTLEPKPGGFLVRLRYGRDAAGKPQRDRFLIATRDERVAADIEIRMHAAAGSLAKLKHPKAHEFLTDMGKVAGDEKAFRALEAVLRKLVAEAGAAPAPAADSGPKTFGAIMEAWTSGQLRRDYPDDVREKRERGRKIDRATLSVFLPVLGNKAIAEITKEDIQAAKRAIPHGVDPDTRVLYLKRLRMVFRLAAHPLDLIAVSPKDVERLPAGKGRNLFWFLYPDEEARLLACTEIPLLYRVLYGWLHRNGSRITETLHIDYGHLDLDRSRVHLEAAWTKTRRARFWDIEADVASAMRVWKEMDPGATHLARVFRSPGRKTLSDVTVMSRLHADLLKAGVDRRELHVTTTGSRRLRVHDSRAGFCTMALRRGMTADWIMDRSGHEAPSQLEQYLRLRRHADEQHLPIWYAPMDEAIPEIRRKLGKRVGQWWAKPQQTSGKQAGSRVDQYSMTESGTEAPEAKTPQKDAPGSPESPLPTTSGPASFQGVGQSGPGQAEVPPEPTVAPEDPVEKALAFAITEATKKGRFDVVLACTNELAARRRLKAAEPPSELERARAKREKGEGK